MSTESKLRKHGSKSDMENGARNENVSQGAQQEQIIARARALFFASGFRSVTMDELARELGMSKKTLYQNFASKDELVRAVVASKFDQIEDALKGILVRELSIGEQMRLVLARLHAEASEVQPAFVRDVQRGNPALFQSIDQRRSAIIRKYLGQLVEQGRVEGFVRKNLRPQLMMEILLTVVQQVITPANLARHDLSPNEALEQVIGVFLNGILVHPGEDV